MLLWYLTGLCGVIRAIHKDGFLSFLPDPWWSCIPSLLLTQGRAVSLLWPGRVDGPALTFHGLPLPPSLQLESLPMMVFCLPGVLEEHKDMTCV